MGTYSALRDAFSELNRTIIDSQQWGAQHELNKEKLGMQRMQVESQLQDSALKRESLKKEAAIAKDQMSEEVVNIFNLVGNNPYIQDKMFDKSDSGIKFAKAMGGSTVDRATGVVYNDFGEPLKLKKYQIGELSAQNYSLISSSLDPSEMAQVNIESANAKLEALQKELASVPVHDVAKRAALKGRIAEGQSVLKEQLSVTSPRHMTTLYRARNEAAQNLAMQAATRGATPSTLQALQEAARQTNKDYEQAVSKESQFELEGQRQIFETKKQGQAFSHAETLQSNRLAAESKAADLKYSRDVQIAKSKADKAAQGTLRTAVLSGPDGSPVATVEINVPKNVGGVYTPESFGEQYKDFKWKEHLEIENQHKTQGNAKSAEVEKNLQHRWSVSTVDDLGTPKEILPEAHRKRLEASIIVANKMIKDNPRELNNPSDIASTSKRAVQAAEEKFWKDYELFESEMVVAKKISMTTLTPEKRSMMIDMFAKMEDKDGSSFFSDLGYTPNWKYKDSLFENDKVKIGK